MPQGFFWRPEELWVRALVGLVQKGDACCVAPAVACNCKPKRPSAPVVQAYIAIKLVATIIVRAAILAIRGRVAIAVAFHAIGLTIMFTVCAVSTTISVGRFVGHAAR